MPNRRGALGPQEESLLTVLGDVSPPCLHLKELAVALRTSMGVVSVLLGRLAVLDLVSPSPEAHRGVWCITKKGYRVLAAWQAFLAALN